MSLYEDLKNGLCEAIAMERGEIPITKKEGMPAPTFVATNKEQALIDEAIQIRKSLNITQRELANLTGSQQQAISRIENKEHSPSLKLFYSIIDALGYELKLVKK